MSTATELQTITFTIYGRPQQRGSKQANVRYGRDGQPISKNGRVLTFAKDDNESSKEWMNLVRDKAVEAMRGIGLIECPVVLTARFYFVRPMGHFATGKNAGQLKPSAPLEHSQTPDLSMLLRCIEDGMTGVVYRDDRQICRYGTETGKYWTNQMARAELRLELIEVPEK